MSIFVGTPPFLKPLSFAIEFMYFHIAKTGLIFMTTLFRISGVLKNNLAPMGNCPYGCRVSKIDPQTIHSSSQKMKGAFTLREIIKTYLGICDFDL